MGEPCRSPSDPSRQARNASRSGGAYRLCRLAQWGSTTRQRRGAGGGHQAVYAFDLQGQETGDAAAAQQQNREQQEAEREDRETASRREKAQAKGERRCVSTVCSRPAGPPAFEAVSNTGTIILPDCGHKKAPVGAFIAVRRASGMHHFLNSLMMLMIRIRMPVVTYATAKISSGKGSLTRAKSLSGGVISAGAE